MCRQRHSRLLFRSILRAKCSNLIRVAYEYARNRILETMCFANTLCYTLLWVVKNYFTEKQSCFKYHVICYILIDYHLF